MKKILLGLIFLGLLHGCEREEDFPIYVRVVNESGLALSDVLVDLTGGSGEEAISRLPEGQSHWLSYERGDGCSRHVSATIPTNEELRGGALCAIAEPLSPGRYVLTLMVETGNNGPYLSTTLNPE